MLRLRKTVSIDTAAIDQLLALGPPSAPGVVVGISQNGLPVYRACFGVSDLETGDPLTATTRLRIGSITKHFTCLAFMLLVEDGLVAIDDPAFKYVPELVGNEGVTFRHLMTHTSGLRDSQDLLFQFSGEKGCRVSVAEMVASYRNITDTNFSAGNRWAYNNGAYLLLSSAIEVIAGMAFGDVLRERIFKPAGMLDTHLQGWDTGWQLNCASQYSSQGDDKFRRETSRLEASGEGGVSSTLDDMLKWFEKFNTPGIARSSTWDTMVRPAVLENGAELPYGFGIMRRKYRGLDLIGHSGYVFGGNAYFIEAPSLGLGIVTMLNRRDVSAVELTDKILDACVAGLNPSETRHHRTNADGVYKSPTTGRAIHIRPAISLHAPPGLCVDIDGVAMMFCAVDDSTLATYGEYELWDYSLSLERPNFPDWIELSAFGQKDTYQRVHDDRSDRGDGIVGKYIAASCGVRAEIAVSGGRKVILSTWGNYGSSHFELKRVVNDVWTAVSCGEIPWGGTITFKGNDHFSISTAGRTLDLIFRRVPQGSA